MACTFTLPRGPPLKATSGILSLDRRLIDYGDLAQVVNADDRFTALFHHDRVSRSRLQSDSSPLTLAAARAQHSNSRTPSAMAKALRLVWNLAAKKRRPRGREPALRTGRSRRLALERGPTTTV